MSSSGILEQVIESGDRQYKHTIPSSVGLPVNVILPVKMWAYKAGDVTGVQPVRFHPFWWWYNNAHSCLALWRICENDFNSTSSGMYRFFFSWTEYSHIRLLEVDKHEIAVGDILALIMDARSASVHVIFCRCFLYFYIGRLSWPNGWTDLHETFTRGRY